MVVRISGGKCSDMRGWIPSLCVCDANECGAIFIFYFIFWVIAPPPVPRTLYSDCLQARRHFPVKVSLMNSNDPSEWLWQVIHNHSSFTFSSSPVTSLLFLPYFLLFLQLNQTPVPIKGHNSLSLSFFNCGCWVKPLNRLLIRMDAARVIFMISDQGVVSGNELQNTEPEVTDQPKVRAGFPITPLSHTIIYHHKHIWASFILLKRLSSEKCSEWNNTSVQLKSKSKRYPFTLFYSVSILNLIQLKTPSVTLISLNLFLYQTQQPSTSVSRFKNN